MDNQVNIKEITKDLNIDYHTFLHQSQRLFIEEKLKEIKAQIHEITGKYNIQSIAEFDKLYQEGKIEEHTSMEDFKKLDRLEYQRDKLETYLQQVENA